MPQGYYQEKVGNLAVYRYKETVPRPPGCNACPTGYSQSLLNGTLCLECTGGQYQDTKAQGSFDEILAERSEKENKLDTFKEEEILQVAEGDQTSDLPLHRHKANVLLLFVTLLMVLVFLQVVEVNMFVFITSYKKFY